MNELLFSRLHTFGLMAFHRLPIPDYLVDDGVKNGEIGHLCRTPPVISNELESSLLTLARPWDCEYDTRRWLANFSGERSSEKSTD